MSVLPIYLFGTEVLRSKAKPVKELDNSTVKLVYDMFETMRASNGIGLAATQVGDLRRVIVVDVTEAEEPPDGEEPVRTAPPDADVRKRFVMINPEVLHEEGSWTIEEGCLSIPNVRGEVERAEAINVRYLDGEFREQEVRAEGLLARVILHEIDHLDGVLFIDRMNRLKRAALRSQLRQIRKGDVETSYPVISTAEV
jgi:peptide deformylase